MVLQVGELAEAVTVTGDAALIETTTATVSQEQIVDLPIAQRDLTQTIFLQAAALQMPMRTGDEPRPSGGMGDKLVVAGQRMALLDEHVNVQLPGGQVMVSWRGYHSPVWLTGNAELVSEGMMDLED